MRDILDTVYYFLALIVCISLFFNYELGLVLGFILMLVYFPIAICVRIFHEK